MSVAFDVFSVHDFDTEYRSENASAEYETVRLSRMSCERLTSTFGIGDPAISELSLSAMSTV
ncbi:hypothetical protein, partial [Halorubrum cibi]|uniref:hypothetical protein n=1 Tax=Halorubrum cibi TaxID=413815 RepID=UPI001C8F8E5C